MQTIVHHTSGETFDARASYVTYTTGVNTHPFRDKSGAYIFQPDGPANVCTYIRVIMFQYYYKMIISLKMIACKPRSYNYSHTLNNY